MLQPKKSISTLSIIYFEIGQTSTHPRHPDRPSCAFEDSHFLSWGAAIPTKMVLLGDQLKAVSKHILRLCPDDDTSKRLQDEVAARDSRFLQQSIYLEFFSCPCSYLADIVITCSLTEDGPSSRRLGGHIESKIRKIKAIVAAGGSIPAAAH